MLRREYDQACSVARSLEVLGERWTLLVIRDVFNGKRRFDAIQQDLGIARNVLAARLTRLVDAGILEKRPYQQRPTRHEYFLTEKGLDLWPVIVAMMDWGDRHLAETGPPVVIHHKDCGGVVDGRGYCRRCGERLNARDAYAEPGPGGAAGYPSSTPGA
ncbi:MAG TPA: helix-turn-helix domain-containing protein [Solirubrobacterales bacterium]|nr:helix-turn-helix domain-containing protein [Solirubrobacterales bacterium]